MRITHLLVYKSICSYCLYKTVIMVVISRFLGGSNIKNALQRVECQDKWYPIFDYLKEACQTKQDVDTYHNQLLSDIAVVRENSGKGARNRMLALKASSFTSHPFYLQMIVNCINEAHWAGMEVLIDAENNAMKGKETIIWDYLKRMGMTSDVYKTFQMYRKDALEELSKDIEEGSIKCFKLVRGAYLYQDKDIVYDSKPKVDKSYDEGVALVISRAARHRPDVKLLVATHNKQSVYRAITTSMRMIDYEKRQKQIKFAQLLGMSDKLTDGIVYQGYDAYKYVPYGNYVESIPYLLRRLYENIDILKHVK